jgi:serine/threonine protein kinase
VKASGQTAVEFGRGDGPLVREVDPMIGRVIAGKYRIRSRVGGGAMGVVYDAKQIALDKRVAIKVLNDDLQQNKHFVARFQVEAKAASLLDHANSTRVFDFGKDQKSGLLYICMEFLEGKSLLEVIESQGPLPAARIVDLTAQTLAALARAHDLGILHRDLKPENIMVLKSDDDEGTSRDVVKVCDFGIAKFDPRAHLTNSSPPGAGSENDWSDLSDSPSGSWKIAGASTAPSALTQVGLIIGTPDYMSPEQARGEVVDERSEIYSVGVVLYQMLAGRVPFEGGDVLETLTRHMTVDPEPPSSFRPNVDEELEAICRIAMSKDPAVRYRSARDMRAALRSTSACRRVGGGRAAMFSFVPPELAMRPSAGDGGPSWSMVPDAAPTMQPPLSMGMAPAIRALLSRSARAASSAALGATMRAPLAQILAVTMPVPGIEPGPSARPTAHVPGSRISGRAASARSTPSSRSPALPVAKLALQESAARRSPLPMIFAAGLTAMFLGGAFAVGAHPKVATAAPREIDVDYAAHAAALAVEGEPGPTRAAPAASAAIVAAVATPASTPAPTAALPAAMPPPLARHGKSYPAVEPTREPSAASAEAPPFQPEKGRVAVVREDAEGFERHLVNELLGRASLKQCYVEALKAHGSAATGSAVLALQVEAGKVSGMSLGSDLGLESLRDCLDTQIVGQPMGDDGTAAGSAHVTLQFTDL